MPKVLLGNQKDTEVVQSIICEFAGKALLDMPAVAKRAGIPKTTFYARLRDPDTFRRWELKAVCKALKIPDERKNELL